MAFEMGKQETAYFSMVTNDVLPRCISKLFASGSDLFDSHDRILVIEPGHHQYEGYLGNKPQDQDAGLSETHSFEKISFIFKRLQLINTLYSLQLVSYSLVRL